jgi:hypothetical protein
VIEFVSGWAVSPNVQSANVAIHPVPAFTGDFQFFFERKGTSQIGQPLYGFAQLTRLYSDPGGEVSYCVARSNEAGFADSYGYRLRITGYLVDAS